MRGAFVVVAAIFLLDKTVTSAGLHECYTNLRAYVTKLRDLGT